MTKRLLSANAERSGLSDRFDPPPSPATAVGAPWGRPRLPPQLDLRQHVPPVAGDGTCTSHTPLPSPMGRVSRLQLTRFVCVFRLTRRCSIT